LVYSYNIFLSTFTRIPGFLELKSEESHKFAIGRLVNTAKDLLKTQFIGTKDTHSFRNSLPSKKVLRKMGLLSDQGGILRRYIDESESWDEHLNNTKQVIKEFIIENRGRSVSIFGSGWMLDIPVRFLAEEMQMVVFYDLRHPRGVLDKYGKYTNFRFMEMDLTGGLLGKAYEICHRTQKPSIKELTEELIPSEFDLPLKTDYFISLNVLTQLDILLIDYLKKHFDLPIEPVQNIRKIIQTYHLKMLTPGHSCLISDVEEIQVNDKNEFVGTIPLIFAELPLNELSKTWIWQFDTKKAYHPEFRTYMRVGYVYL
jgi:hypothetical protein